MKFGYARVSTKEQNLDTQLERLEDAGCERIFSEKVSGANSERKELNRLLDMLREGDTLCVTSLDRLGRQMLKLTELINEFKDKGIHFESLDNSINTSTPVGMLMFNMCAAFAEMERELLKERVQAGIEAAKANGRSGGRPRSLTPEKADKLVRLRKSGEFSVKQMCEMTGISRSVYYRHFPSTVNT